MGVSLKVLSGDVKFFERAWYSREREDLGNKIVSTSA